MTRLPPRGRQRKDTYKFMQVLNGPVFGRLKLMAKRRGITVQEVIRCVAIPEWLQVHDLMDAERAAYFRQAKFYAEAGKNPGDIRLAREEPRRKTGRRAMKERRRPRDRTARKRNTA